MNAMQWGALWGLLNERFGVNKSDELGAFYFAELSAVLSDEELKAGVRKILVASRFFPSPDEIMQAAGLSEEANALAEWETCMAVMEGRRGAYERLSETGKRLVRLMGGQFALTQTPLESVPFVRKEWLKLYADANEVAAHERRMLAPMTPEGRKLLAAALAGQVMPSSDEDAA